MQSHGKPEVRQALRDRLVQELELRAELLQAGNILEL